MPMVRILQPSVSAQHPSTTPHRYGSEQWLCLISSRTKLVKNSSRPAIQSVNRTKKAKMSTSFGSYKISLLFGYATSSDMSVVVKLRVKCHIIS